MAPKKKEEGKGKRSLAIKQKDAKNKPNLKADGRKDGPRRTRKHIGDKATGKNDYEVEKIVAMKFENGIRYWLVH